jgi:putative transposase
MIRDRGSNLTAVFDAILADAGIRTVLCNVRAPRMNAITERWIGGCRRELLDRTLIWNGAHLRLSCASTRPTTTSTGLIGRWTALKPLPEPADLGQYRVRRQARVGGLINEYPPGRVTWTRFSDA